MSAPGHRLGSRLSRLPLAELNGIVVSVATTRGARLLGLAHLDRAEARPLLIPRCRAVHTFGMRFPLDLYFLDAGDVVVEHRRAVPPRRFAFCGEAEAVLEVPAGGGGENRAAAA
jgi:hypothetical protein